MAKETILKSEKIIYGLGKIFARHLCNKELIQYYLRNIHNLKYFLKDLKMDKGVEQTFLQRYINSQ